MRIPTLLFGSCLLLTACVTPGARAPISGADEAHPTAAQRWLRTELYFGLGPAGDPAAGASEQRWREFLDREITPRFPDGLSVYDVYGQWRGKGAAAIERLHSKEVLLLHADTPRQRADIDAIRDAWKRTTGDTSVLRVTQPAEVSF